MAIVSTCPSGLVIEFRPMIVADEDAIAAAYTKGGRDRMHAYDHLLGACAQRVVNPGPYAFTEARFAQYLSGDRAKCLIDLRNEAFEPILPAVGKCPAGHAINDGIDLRELPIFPMDADTAAAMKAQRPLEFRLPHTGRLVRWQMLTGELEDAVVDLSEEHQTTLVSEMLAIRIVDVEGFNADGLDAETNEDLRGWLRNLPARDSRAFRQHIADTEPGVNPVVTVPCPRSGCTGAMRVHVMESPDFFPLSVDRRS
jgi:hypothetical protein